MLVVRVELDGHKIYPKSNQLVWNVHNVYWYVATSKIVSNKMTSYSNNTSTLTELTEVKCFPVVLLTRFSTSQN